MRAMRQAGLMAEHVAVEAIRTVANIEMGGSRLTAVLKVAPEGLLAALRPLVPTLIIVGRNGNAT